MDVVYTPWANLRKTASMAVGQACAFHAAVARIAHRQSCSDRDAMLQKLMDMLNLVDLAASMQDSAHSMEEQAEAWSSSLIAYGQSRQILIHRVQVGFKDQKAVKKVVALKSNEIVNRLNRTKREEFPNLEGQREAFDAEVRPTYALCRCGVACMWGSWLQRNRQSFGATPSGSPVRPATEITDLQWTLNGVFR